MGCDGAGAAGSWYAGSMTLTPSQRRYYFGLLVILSCAAGLALGSLYPQLRPAACQPAPHAVILKKPAE